jgi:DNA-binding response OmpR family regulator
VRLLIVETRCAQAATYRGCLKAEGFEVDLATNEEDAEHKGHTVGYDLILLSLLLPDERGLSLLRGWRRAGVNCPVLALAGSDRVAERVHCLDLGADDYLARPFQLADLLARIRALLRRAHRITDPVVRVHDLEIDTNSRTVRRAGRMIHLTRREYSLLQFLAFNRGKVVSRSLIWEHLYDEQEETTSNVVDVYIRYLRGKIDKGFDLPLILTRWGQGYMLRGEEYVDGPDHTVMQGTDRRSAR